MEVQRLYFGSDHAAVELRRHLVAVARREGHVVLEEVGPSDPADPVDYPDIAAAVCAKILADPGARGVLVCGTGQGMALAANRRRGIRAVVCSESFSAALGRAHNDANVLCLGQRVCGLGLAETIFLAFCRERFEGGRHARRVAKFDPLGE